jgi:selenide,water dikinase
MARASGVTLSIDAGQVPVFDGVLAIASRNRSGGMGSNEEHFASAVRLEPGVDAERQSLLYDPQTSGGLLIAAGAEASDEVEAALRARQVPVARIGRAVAAEAGVQIVVRR